MKGASASCAWLHAVVVLLATLPPAAQAGVIQLTSPRRLAGAGITTAEFTSPQDLLPSPLVLTFPANSVTFTLAMGDWRRADQGVNFFGDFDPGTQLLYTNNNNVLSFDGVTSVGGGGSGPMEIAFAVGVEIVGLRAQTDIIGPEHFTFSLYNGSLLLGTFTADGISGQRADEQFAVLLGAKTTGDDVITRMVISSLAYQGGDVHPNRFAIGPVKFGVPEPATLALLLVGVASALQLRRRRSSPARSAGRANRAT